PRAPHRLIAAVVDEVRAEHALAVAEKDVRAVPLVDTEVEIEAVGDGVPRDLPAHPRLHARKLRLRPPRHEREASVARIQVRDVGNLIGHHGTAATAMLGPAEDTGFEECAIDDQLTTPPEQVEQTQLAVRPVKSIRFLD